MKVSYKITEYICLEDNIPDYISYDDVKYMEVKIINVYELIYWKLGIIYCIIVLIVLFIIYQISDTIFY